MLNKICCLVCIVMLTACAAQQGTVRNTIQPAMAPTREVTPPLFNAEDGFQLALAAYKVNDGMTAFLLSRQVMQQHPATPWYKRALLLNERALIMLDRPAEADAAMLRAQAEYPDLGDYAVYVIAEYHYSKARYTRALSLYQHLLAKYPYSSLRSIALLRSGLALSESYAYAAAVGILEQFLTENTRPELAPTAGIALGRALTAEAALPEAVRAYQNLLVRYPGSSSEPDVEKALAELNASGIVVPELSSAELYLRGRNLYRAGQYDKALEAYTKLLERDPLSTDRAESLLRSGVALYNLNKRAEAAAVLEKMLRQYPEDVRVPEALYWMGRSYSKLGAWEKALQAFGRILDRFPEDEWADDALFLSGNIFRETKDTKRSLLFYGRLADKYPDSKFSDSAIWWQAWAYYGKDDHQLAEQRLQELIKRYPRSFLVHQARYWLGRIAEKRGDASSAANHYARLLEKGLYTYYGHRAAKRLERLKGSLPADGSGSETLAVCAEMPCLESPLYPGNADAALPHWNEETKRLLAAEPSFRAALELRYQDMKREAAAELSLLQDKAPIKRSALIGLSKVFFELEDYHRSFLLTVRNYERYLETPSNGVSSDLWLLAYPKGYWESIAAYAKQFEQDPYFIAALIREESQFRAEARSPAGARGLMQVMPATGMWAAKLNNMKGFDSEKLFDPDTGIQIGTWYVRHLMKQFKGDTLLVAAAYNAGPEAVSSWLERYNVTTERDEFVESIPYAETRGYVKKVLRNYEEYRRLYGSAPGDKGKQKTITN